MKPYLDLLQNIMTNGMKKEDRTGTGTISVFGTQSRYDLRQGFPATTTKKLFFKGVVHELLWMLSGETNILYLQQNGVHIWDEWADEDGNLGPVYGAQWRKWKAHDNYGQVSTGEPDFIREREIDQIKEVIKQIKKNPDSRRHIVTAWNPAEIDQMKLPPCHMMFQFYVVNEELSCHMYQRSADTFLGVPFNIASYSLLIHMVAQVCGLKVGEFVHTISDAHIYRNHLTQVNVQLSREQYPLPTLWLNPEIKDIDKFKYEDVRLENYQSHPAIKADIAV